MTIRNRAIFRAAALVLSAAALPGCHLNPQPPPEPSGTCSAACAHLRDLGCPDGQPTPAGTSCEAVCEDTTTSGLVRLDLGCLATINACSEEPRCSR